MIQYQKRKEVKSGGMQSLAVGFLCLYFATFAQGMDDKKGEGQNILKFSTEVSNDPSAGNQPCLMGLADEILVNIFGYLSPGNLVHISEVNHKIYNICYEISYDNTLWEKHVLESQRTDGSYRAIFKDLCLNPIVFQFYNNSQLIVNFHFGYKYISDGSEIENMSTMASLPHNGLWTLRKNNFPEDIRNSIQPSHCVYQPQGPGLPLRRINLRQEHLVGSCLDILQVQEFGYVMLDFNTISSLR